MSVRSESSSNILRERLMVGVRGHQLAMRRAVPSCNQDLGRSVHHLTGNYRKGHRKHLHRVEHIMNEPGPSRRTTTRAAGIKRSIGTADVDKGTLLSYCSILKGCGSGSRLSC